MQKLLNGSRSCFRVNTLGVSRNLVLDWSADPHIEGEGKILKILPIVDPLHISRLAEARELKFGMLTEGSKLCKSRSYVVWIGVMLPTFKFLDPLVFLEWLMLDTSACAEYAVHLVQSLPNYFGLLFGFFVYWLYIWLLCAKAA